MDPRAAAWWDAVVAGEEGEPHPIFRDRISVRVTGERLKISGRLDRPEDRDELLEQARSYVGRGIVDVDASGLEVAETREKPGLLDQTLVASFPDRATAELARNVVLERSGVTPKRAAVIDREGAAKLPNLLPAEFVEDAKKRLDRGEALLVLRVDETDAFKIRMDLDEDRRSRWAISTPPEVAADG